MQGTLQETKERQCGHEDLRFLGEDRGRNRFFVCESCGAVVIEDGMRRWVIPSR